MLARDRARHDRSRRLATLLAGVAIGATLLAPAAGAAPPLHSLGPLLGTPSYAADINLHGVVVGDSWVADLPRAYAHDLTTGATTDLGTLGGPVWHAYAVNDDGLVVGSSSIDAGEFHPFVYDLATGVMTDIGTLGGDSAEAVGVNDDGVVVGYSTLGPTGPYHAFAYDTSTATMTDLGTLGGPSSQAGDVNDDGIIVGTSDTSDAIDNPAPHAFAYDLATGTMTDLDTIGQYSRGQAINDAGVIVGTASTPGFAGNHAFRYDLTSGVVTDLGTLGGYSSEAADINDDRFIVGSSDPPGNLGGRAWVLAPGAGSLVDLGTLGGDRSWATGINDAGTIVGTSNVTGSFSDFDAFTAQLVELPGAPTLQGDTTCSGNALTWAPPAFTGYPAADRTLISRDGALLATVPTGTTTFTDVTSGTHTDAVAAANRGGTGPASEPVVLATPVCPPPEPAPPVIVRPTFTG